MKIGPSFLLAVSATIVGGLVASAAGDGHRTAVAAPTASANAEPLLTTTQGIAVPVTGTVTAQQGGAWNVGIAGIPSVTIANTPTVSLGNAAAQPLFFRNVEDRGRVPYQSINLVSPGASCSGQQCSFSSAQVPPGHRLVVEHISGAFAITIGTTPKFITVSVEHQSGAELLGFTLAPPFSGGLTWFERPVLFYVDEGQFFTFNAGVDFASSFDSGANQTFAATGYLLDCTAAPCAPFAQ
jgi:hypothetical protein